MIDFSTLQGVTIPEGVVEQIEDSNGVVLWSAEKIAKVTITSTCVGIDGDTSRITITSSTAFSLGTPNASSTAYTHTVEPWELPNCTIEIPVGSTIECFVTRSKENQDCCIILNGEEVVSGEGTYLYTVTGNVTVDVSDRYTMGEYGVITITEEGR